MTRLVAAARLSSTLLAALWLAACAGGRATVVEQLDERTGVMLLHGREPAVFARTEPRYSRSMRDYLYLGPVETNRQGVREYYLWVGVATTLDRGFIAPPAEAPTTLYVTIAGEPMELPLAPWRELVRTAITDPVYATAVPLMNELAARVTLQQLTLLDAAQLQSVSVDAGGGSAPRAYVRWESGTGFQEFLQSVGR
jgi:hypothetical protein